MCGLRSKGGLRLSGLLLLLFLCGSLAAQDASEMTTTEIIDELLRSLNERSNLLDERESLLTQRESNLQLRSGYLDQTAQSLGARQQSLDERENSLLAIETSLKSYDDAVRREILTWKLVAAGSVAGATALLVWLAVR